VCVKDLLRVGGKSVMRQKAERQVRSFLDDGLHDNRIDDSGNAESGLPYVVPFEAQKGDDLGRGREVPRPSLDVLVCLAKCVGAWPPDGWATDKCEIMQGRPHKATTVGVSFEGQKTSESQPSGPETRVRNGA
jgi:hypothetical protein